MIEKQGLGFPSMLNDLQESEGMTEETKKKFLLFHTAIESFDDVLATLNESQKSRMILAVDMMMMSSVLILKEFTVSQTDARIFTLRNQAEIARSKLFDPEREQTIWDVITKWDGKKRWKFCQAASAELLAKDITLSPKAIETRIKKWKS